MIDDLHIQYDMIFYTLVDISLEILPLVGMYLLLNWTYNNQPIAFATIVAAMAYRLYTVIK